MFCCTLLYVHSSIAIILMGKRELIALLDLSSWRLVMVELLFLAVPRGCLRSVIVVFPDHTHLLFFQENERLLKPDVSFINPKNRRLDTCKVKTAIRMKTGKKPYCFICKSESHTPRSCTEMVAENRDKRISCDEPVTLLHIAYSFKTLINSWDS